MKITLEGISSALNKELTLEGISSVLKKEFTVIPGFRKCSGSVLLLIFITVFAAFLRFYGLANRGFWLDETFSVDFAQKSLPNLLSFREGGTNMPLYHLLLHFWMKLGDSEFLLRSMSVLFSVAAIPFLYAIGCRLFGRPAGLIAAWLLALNAYDLHYAQEARAYAMVVLLATISSLLLIRNLQEPPTASWALYGVFLSLTVYCHLLGLLVAVAHGLAVLCLPPRSIPWKGLARSAVCFALLTLPLAVRVLQAKADPLNWVPKPDASLVLSYLILCAGNGGELLLLADAIVIALFILQSTRSWWREGRSLENWSYLLVLFWFVAPLALALSISVLRPTFVPRYFLYCLPAFLLAVSSSLSRIRPLALAWALGIAISILGLSAVPQSYHLAGTFEDWRVISSSVLQQSVPGDGIFFYPEYASIPFEYYRARTVPLPSWPEPITVGPPPSPEDTAPSHESSRNDGEKIWSASKLWLIIHHPSTLSPQQRKNLAANLACWQVKGWTLRSAREFPSVIVLMLAASSSDALPPAQLPGLSHPYTSPPSP